MNALRLHDQLQEARRGFYRATYFFSGFWKSRLILGIKVMKDTEYSGKIFQVLSCISLFAS